jgi:membrane glycosyltransferase
MKMDNYNVGGWNDIFWPFWVIISLLIGLSFTLALIFLAKIISIICIKTETYESKFFAKSIIF